MSETDKQPVAKAPKPGRGYTVVELRTPHQADIVKASGNVPLDEKSADRWIVVKNTDAQTVVDTVIAENGSVGIFDRRVLDFFVAMVMLANPTVTDSRSSLHQRLISVGRDTDGFTFHMKQDGTLTVS